MARKRKDSVRDQYETYPYPERNPSDEARRLVTGSPSHFPELSHHLFAGRWDWDRPMRIMVAGGGTGDALAMLAQQTADAGVPAEILYLDLSEASRSVAEARIEARGLTDRVRFETGSLLDAASFGPFDYVDCCGVLHHLEAPVAGLRALADALSPEGGMGIMVYGRLGRTGVYDLQDALRSLASETALAPEKRVATAKALLECLPETNRFRRNSLMRDHLSSDAGLYDLLLHSRDRAYLVSELAADIQAAGLRVVHWIDPLRYDPDIYLPDPMLRRRAAGLTPVARAALAEMLAGNMRKHICYLVPAARETDCSARLSRRAVPVFRDAETQQLFRSMPPGADLPLEFDGLNLLLPLPKQTREVVSQVDGHRSLEEIWKSVPGSGGWRQFESLFAEIFRILNGVSKLFLKVPSGR